MRPTAITLDWADGTHTFDLPLGQIREIEDKCKAGIFVIASRLAARACGVDDVREVLRCGLIGGGKTPTEALVLVSRYVDDRPLAESVVVALVVVGALITGRPESTDDDDESPQPPATDASTSAGFTLTGQ